MGELGVKTHPLARKVRAKVNDGVSRSLANDEKYKSKGELEIRSSLAGTFP